MKMGCTMLALVWLAIFALASADVSNRQHVLENDFFGRPKAPVPYQQVSIE